MQLVEIEARLREPFAFEDIDFLPKGKVERDGKTLCMALPYADPRVYQDRLNTIAYGEWSTPAPVVIAAGNKLICYVTVILCGVPHTDVGEATNNEENTGTEAWAQAFKRACSQFGLGRYLYDLEKEWVPFNPQKKQIDLDKASKQAIVRKMYQKAGVSVGDVGKNGAKSQSSQQAGGDAPATEQQLTSIRKLLQHLGKPEEIREDLRYLEAKEIIVELSRQYNEQRQKKQPEQAPAPVLRNGDGSPAIPAQDEQSDVLKQMLAKCKQRAFAVGIKTRGQWEAFRKQYAHAESDEQVTIDGVGSMNGELTIREKGAKSA